MGGCPQTDGSGPLWGEPIVGSVTFKQLITYINYGCFAFTFVFWLIMTIPHLRNYRAPDEQRPIFRIISTPIVFCLIALIAVHAYSAAEYLDPIASLYEAYALASLFLLYVHYVVPEARNRNEFFSNLEARSRKGRPIRDSGLRWFMRIWKTVFFFVVIYTILIIIQEILQATGHACSTTKKGKRGQIIISTLQTIAMVYALLAILRFQRRLTKYMEGRRAIMKLVAFKLFVAIQVVQRFVFHIVTTQVGGGAKVTYRDISIGLPALLTSIECLIFSFWFYFTFHSNEYKEVVATGDKRYRTFRALLHALNPIDLIHGVIIACTPGKTPSFGNPDDITAVQNGVKPVYGYSTPPSAPGV